MRSTQDPDNNRLEDESQDSALDVGMHADVIQVVGELQEEEQADSLGQSKRK